MLPESAYPQTTLSIEKSLELPNSDVEELVCKVLTMKGNELG